MNITEAKEKITALIAAAEDDYRWGGDETSNGALIPGHVKWENLKEDISAILDRLVNDSDESAKMPIVPNPEPHECSSDDGVSVSYWANLNGANFD
jgi:hypothetical protein